MKKKQKPPRDQSRPLTTSQEKQVAEMIERRVAEIAHEKIDTLVLEGLPVVLDRLERTSSAPMLTQKGREAIDDAGSLARWAIFMSYEPLSAHGVELKRKEAARIADLRAAAQRAREDAIHREATTDHVATRPLGPKGPRPPGGHPAFANGVRIPEGDES